MNKNKILRFPRLAKSAPDHHQRFPRHYYFPRLANTDDKDQASLAELVHRAREMMMGTLHTMRLEMGHIFSRIKRKVRDSGDRWKAFYNEQFQHVHCLLPNGLQIYETLAARSSKGQGGQTVPFQAGH